jgi:hypothetical protein
MLITENHASHTYSFVRNGNNTLGIRGRRSTALRCQFLASGDNVYEHQTYAEACRCPPLDDPCYHLYGGVGLADALLVQTVRLCILSVVGRLTVVFGRDSSV